MPNALKVCLCEELNALKCVFGKFLCPHFSNQLPWGRISGGCAPVVSGGLDVPATGS